MSNEQLFQQVSFLLQRTLTPEERKFLALASQTLSRDKIPQRSAASPKVKVAKIAV